jgi:protein TonB
MPSLSPTPEEKPPDPLPSRSVVAPVVMTASQPHEKEGVVEHPAPVATAGQGPGIGGRSGAGQGEGNGDGLGSGLGDGSGGGAGGGPYRGGSGIEPPRLLREVKADYTESARRRQLAGDVVLEIVVNRDGSVGKITVKKGLGEGLDQRAVEAVRQWQFAPAKRRGEAVDVIVEVSVEFKLR